SDEYQKCLRAVRHLHAGGLVLVNRIIDGRVRSAEPYATAAFLNRMQRVSRLPLLVAGDFERGDSMRLDSKTLFPHAMAFAAAGDVELSRAEGAITARQGVALGIPWILAPVADVNNNPDNPIINTRSYGENPETVSAHVRAFIQGVHSVKTALVTVKHFPGHGDTSTDTHLALAVNNAARERLDRIEFAPFRTAIAAGVDSVMSAHIAVPALDAPGIPATLSQPILTGLLRDALGFRGLISTDALDMQGIAHQWSAGQAAVKAIQAGVDVLLMPADPEAAINAVVAAVRRGDITRARIDRSLRRVLAAKVYAGLDRRRTVDLDRMLDQLDTPEDIQSAQTVAERALTLVRNERNLVPLSASGKSCFLILTENRVSQQGRVFAAEVRKRSPKAPLIFLDPAASAADIDQAVTAAEACDTVAASAFVSGAAFRGNPALLNRLIDAGKPLVLVSLGNPYLLRAFPKAPAYLATYSNVPPSEAAAAKALYGEIAIGGRLPVSIPGLAALGDGIQLPAVAR
ncbi:MAG TPA: glycoside hydrolase family 3 N-terminal domain-containing protein, partial [Bryobacteraceae bacterium]|nr:glycoside hydrolase family 3 N-terminal domain-containing protein [Bryobacteraceae bacterium]